MNRRQWLALTAGSLGRPLFGATPTSRLTFAEVTAQLEALQHEHPESMTLRTPGRSVQDRPVYAAVVTDAKMPADDKEHVLITTTHSGIEKGATAAALDLLRWLLSDDPIAQETRRRQVVVIMPACHPDGFDQPAFKNEHGFDAYQDWSIEGPKAPAKMPEAVAIQTMMDEYQPEVVSDLHGNDGSFAGYIHFEGHVNNPSLRSYEPEVERLMDEAALAAGFPTHRGEADEQRLYIGPGLGIEPDKQSRKKPRVFAGTYAYHRYHSLLLATENAWPRSCLVRQQRLLRIGNDIWPGERQPGYPTRTILTNSHHIVAAGKTAAERRRSRVELWNKQSSFTHGFSNPQREGFTLYVCATSPTAVEKYLTDATLQGFQQAIQTHPRIDHAALLRQLADHPDGPGQWGSAAKLNLVGNAATKKSTDRLTVGFALRLRIPYPQSTITDLRLNGQPLTVNDSTWVARGFRYVEVPIVGDRLLTDHLFILTCQYQPGERR